MQRRDGGGRFASMPARQPEVTLGAGITPGMRVAHAGIHGLRVIDVADDVLTLRPPHGGRVIAKSTEVTALPETAEQQKQNLREEADIARLLVSVKALSRQNREVLDQDADEAGRAAIEDLSRMFYEGKVSLDRYVYAMRSTERAPLGANHAALAIVMRRQLSDEQYTALTGPARRVGCPLPD